MSKLSFWRSAQPRLLLPAIRSPDQPICGCRCSVPSIWQTTTWFGANECKSQAEEGPMAKIVEYVRYCLSPVVLLRIHPCCQLFRSALESTGHICCYHFMPPSVNPHVAELCGCHIVPMTSLSTRVYRSSFPGGSANNALTQMVREDKRLARSEADKAGLLKRLCCCTGCAGALRLYNTKYGTQAAC